MQNLWEEQQGIEPSGASTKPAAKRRLSTESATLAAMRSWLLHDYVIPYCRSLAATRIFRRCFWIDGLGETRNIAPILQGAEAAAQELAAQNRPMLLQLLALQPGKGNRVRPAPAQARAQSVDTHTKEPVKRAQEKPFVLPQQSAIINADWPGIAPALLEALDQAAALFLLNPLSTAISLPAGATKQERLPFFAQNDLAPLYTRTAPTELCLLLSHAQIESRLLPALRTPAGAAAFTVLLRSDRWKTALADPVGGTRFIAPSSPSPNQANLTGRGEARPSDVISGHLQAAIRPHFLTVQRVTFPVCTGPAAIEDAPYTLLFATRRQDSLVCMNDALCAYRRRLEETSYQGLLNEDWFRERGQARLAGEMQTLLESILRIGRAQTPRRWPDLRQQLLLDRFGNHLQRDYDECISSLLQAGEVRCEWRQRHADHDGQQPPGNEDILYWNKRR